MSPVRVLVADDNRDLVLTLGFLLRDEGYEVCDAHDGREAAVAMAEFDPDVVICDIAMPGRSGWELARWVRKISQDGESLERPFLVAISGRYTTGVDKMLSEMNGFDHFLVKPVDPARLLELLGRYRERVRAAERAA